MMMEENMNLKLLSKYRTELMGIAIFYIFLFHIYDIGYAYKIRSYGYVGVDIFFMLSGIGLIYSWKKIIY
jgi:peptidoglycan/LPS O-acetylase OafA/YrhL